MILGARPQASNAQQGVQLTTESSLLSRTCANLFLSNIADASQTSLGFGQRGCGSRPVRTLGSDEGGPERDDARKRTPTNPQETGTSAAFSRRIDRNRTGPKLLVLASALAFVTGIRDSVAVSLCRESPFF